MREQVRRETRLIKVYNDILAAAKEMLKGISRAFTRHQTQPKGE